MVLVTGATGQVGKELCRLLAQSHIPARAMCRHQEQFTQFTQIGLEAVQGDFGQPDQLRKAMQGCQQLFLLTPPVPQQAQWERLTIDLAVETGIQRIVRVSAADANLTTKVPWAKAHAEADHYLRSKPIDWTIIRPVAFMQNFLELAHPIARGILPHMTGDGQLSYIDSRDIAAVARQLLTQPGHQGAVYFLTGPDSLSLGDIATCLTEVLGHPVRAIQLAVEDMREQLKSASLSDWYINGLIEQYALVAGGYDIDTTEEVKRLTGQPPRTFAQFARDYHQELEAD
ncbi:SDR family oxidoreductase [Spirosoma sp.]|uniref:SDR family oxidoreductase n=1 Tax=Spirosoma sp. TaxID=1899569 RepID=UPI002625E337|nr:SDR family oxidoreductase [Spirosoma sp.]MCX6215299.1 SDR family oxidoreductase [Spirosoma sp.]